MRQRVYFEDLGVTSYAKAWEYQTQIHRDFIARKNEFRQSGQKGLPQPSPEHRLLFVEHPPVYTLGKSGTADHLLLSEAALEKEGFEFFKINRGGDITYHGPGQIVGYPIFDLEYFFTDVHRYVRNLEEAIIQTLALYNIHASRMPGYTGVWLEGTEGRPNRKICAIGVHLSRWVTLHGFAFNVNTNLTHFDNIIPCGIQDADKGVTSLSQELGRTMEMEEVKAILRAKFAEVFEFDFLNEIE